jgi:hypothetical protein
MEVCDQRTVVPLDKEGGASGTALSAAHEQIDTEIDTTTSKASWDEYNKK